MVVLCVGMYRACSTWQYGVAGELLERHRDGQRLGFVDGGRFASSVVGSLDPGRWSVLKAHDAHRGFARRLDRGQALGIYSHRDLRDVAFSWMHKTGQTFDEMIGEGFLSQCLRNDWFWRDRPGMLLQSYEDLIAEPARGVVEIARHLGIELEPGEEVAIADLFSFEANRKRTKDLSARLQAEGVELSSKDQGKFDRQTLLHWNHIRDGRAGYWKELASPEQKARLAEICGPWLIEHGYEVAPDRPEPAAPSIVDLGPEAPDLEGILLDRMFQGRRGTYIGMGADRPTSRDRTSAFHRRGWRGVNIEPAGSASEPLADGRADDLNLQVDLSDADGKAPFDASSLIGGHGLLPPDLFAIDLDGREAQVLGTLPLATWRPKVFVIRAEGPTTDAFSRPSWEPCLLDQGYLTVPLDGADRVYLRGDLADALGHFSPPIAVEPRRTEVLPSIGETERLRTEEALTNLNDYKVELAQLKARFGNELDDRHRHYLAWLDEREGWRVEREALNGELQAGAVERQELQGELRRLQADHHALLIEHRELQVERQASMGRLDAMARRIEELEGSGRALARDVDVLHGVIGRLQGEVRGRDDELERTRAQLRPYLKLDRLGVVPAIQRKVRAHRAHATRDRAPQEVPPSRTRRMELAPGLADDETPDPANR